VLDFPTSVFICENSGVITIGDTSPNQDYIYAWESGEQTAAITVSERGSYTVSVTNLPGGLQCTQTLTIQVEVSLSPEITDIIVSDLEERNSVEVLTAVAGNFEYRLDSGPYQESNVFTDVTAGHHTVTVRDPPGCGLVTENILVMGHPIFFTPNGDGRNDLWHIEGIQLLDSPLVFIYDRFGKLICQLDVRSPGWDGTFGGIEMPSSDYWFKLTYTDPVGQRTEARFLSSHFSLKR
jgi:gliding motility-associated-like protein